MCHNPHTMPLQTPRARSVTVAELVDEVRPQAPYLSGVTVSGGEATLQAPFVAAWFDALHEDPDTAGLTRFVDSNGCADDSVWDLLLPRTEGVMLDLKALDLGTHLELTGSSNFSVLRSLDRLALAHKLAEVRLLIVPGRNDSEEALRATGEYVASRAPGVPVRVIGFRPHGVRAAARSIPEPTAEERARSAPGSPSPSVPTSSPSSDPRHRWVRWYERRLRSRPCSRSMRARRSPGSGSASPAAHRPPRAGG